MNTCRPPRSLAVHVWTAYSPQRAWTDIVTEFESALKALEKGDVGPMQLFVNETLGETWELAGERTDEHALQARAEPYKLCTVPRGALILTAGVDVQRNRWEITVYGWGRGLESWVVDVAVLEGNPAVDEEWGAVLEYLQRRYPQDAGGLNRESGGCSGQQRPDSRQTGVMHEVRGGHTPSPILPGEGVVEHGDAGFSLFCGAGPVCSGIGMVFSIRYSTASL